MTCFFEATNISEGRGTEKPFQYVGAPFVVDERMGAGRMVDVLTVTMNSLRLPGVQCSPIAFTPTASKFKDEASSGIAVEVTSWDSLRPVISGLRMIGVFQKLYPQTEIRKAGLQRLLGSSKAADMLVRGEAVGVLESQWRRSAISFRTKSKRYFIYGSR